MITVDVIIKRKMSFGKGQFICALCVFWLFSYKDGKTKLKTLHSSARKSHFLDVSFLLELKIIQNIFVGCVQESETNCAASCGTFFMVSKGS